MASGTAGRWQVQLTSQAKSMMGTLDWSSAGPNSWIWVSPAWKGQWFWVGLGNKPNMVAHIGHMWCHVPLGIGTGSPHLLVPHHLAWHFPWLLCRHCRWVLAWKHCVLPLSFSMHRKHGLNGKFQLEIAELKALCAIWVSSKCKLNGSKEAFFLLWEMSKLLGACKPME